MLFINGAIRSLKAWCGGTSALRSAVRTRPGVTCSIEHLLSSRVDRASACASHQAAHERDDEAARQHSQQVDEEHKGRGAHRQAGGEERDGHGVEILELEQDDDRSKDSDERYVDVSHC